MKAQNSVKKIVISGQSGYIGSLITKRLEKNGFRVEGIPRNRLNIADELRKQLRSAYAIINLAGAPILQRWTSENRKIIYDSRVQTTKNLVKVVEDLPLNERPRKFISASAIGIYKAGFSHDESSMNFDTGFVGKVVRDWEAPTGELPLDVQQTIFRIGPVIGKKSQMIKRLLLPFKLGLGATIGNGKQAFPFIHSKDLTRAFVWAIENELPNGTYNLVAPETPTNKAFTKTLAKKLKRPAFLFIPGFALKLMFGQAAEMLIQSPEVSADKLLKAGFKFDYPNIDSALTEIVD
ncbi:TIGR01777 family oxidoreductase [Maribellus mangrovi]|uniref:TIGR01777 family oxidoreductase n=1 Tax=Maribellus mangrovi TaxID=3133146 RepID=UPI0030EDF258